eukprot:CAMPEP_0118937222 /NCGR_PEP_ID=MMETSP1169-20130426/22042_1 /TAXON_ID=36882 /ORGANISM="Pyramimonas obovata, Strain CCMP722" /LENGTH=140 /DNA_ID=CAMNT_0006880797 /DNA_START=340 /DNA_END=759 /DNA_ORIENTATION=+
MRSTLAPDPTRGIADGVSLASSRSLHLMTPGMDPGLTNRSRSGDPPPGASDGPSSGSSIESDVSMISLLYCGSSAASVPPARPPSSSAALRGDIETGKQGVLPSATGELWKLCWHSSIRPLDVGEDGKASTSRYSADSVL